MTSNYFLNYCQESVLCSSKRRYQKLVPVSDHEFKRRESKRERKRNTEEKQNEHHLASTVFSSSAIKLKGDLAFC